MISQAELETVLERYLLDCGVTIERGVKVQKITQDAESVVACVTTQDKHPFEIKSQYLVGCDGAHSIVRKSTNLSFVGKAYPQDFILADVHLEWSLRDSVSIFMGAYGFMAFFPIRANVWRMICNRVHEHDSEVEPTLADFKEAIEKLLPADANVILSDERPLWMTRFRLHHRIVDNYQQGRSFLAGDAAHIHSPAGGQGMNTGMQDSINLAWKLAAVIKGERDEDFLATYNIERRRIGEHLLASTDRGFEFMATSNPVYLWLRNTLIPWVMPLLDLSETSKRNRFRFVSELDVRYRHSPIVGQASGWKHQTLRGGNRMPDGKLLKDAGEVWLLSLIHI